MLAQSLDTECKSIYDTYASKSQKTIEIVFCLRCGRSLTNEKSRQAHLGPKCARKLAYETRTQSFSAKTLQCHKIAKKSSIQRDNISTKKILLYYNSILLPKPYCKIGIVSLLAIDSGTTDDYNYRKKFYSFPLLHDVIYEIGVCLPQVRVFLLQVQNQHLKDISTCMY